MIESKEVCDLGRDRDPVEYMMYYIEHDEDVPAFVEWLRQHKVIVLDLETSGLSPFDDKIATIQIGVVHTEEPRAYVLDARRLTRRALQPVFDVLEDKAVVKIGQNIRFECEFLWTNFKVRVRNVMDSQVAEMLLRAGLIKGGKDYGRESGEEGGNRAVYGATSMFQLCKRYFGIKIDKGADVRTSFYTSQQYSMRQLRYASQDVLYPYFILEEQKKQLVNRKLWGVARVEFRVIPILAQMRLHGVKIDQDSWRALWQEAIANRAEAQRELDKLFLSISVQEDLFPTTKKTPLRPVYSGEKELDYNSPYQIRWAIKEYCEAIDWPIKVVTDKKELAELKKIYGGEWFEWVRKRDPNVKLEDAPDWVIPEEKYCVLMDARSETLRLAKIRKQLPAELVDWLIRYGEAAIRATTFGNAFLVKNVRKQDGRIHPEIHQLLAATGRLSESPNLQNIPRDQRYRKCYIPEKGYKFVIADYSQIEPRLMAASSRDPLYVEAFAAGEDVYLESAEAMLGTKPDRSTEDGERQRSIFKTISLAMLYRMGVRKLRDRLTLALEDDILAGKIEVPTFDWARDLHRRFLDVHTGIREFQERMAQLADHRKTDRPKVWDEYRKEAVTWVEGLCGRKRFFASDHLTTYTEAPNAPIQGTSATIMKLAAVLVQEEIEQRGLDATCVHMVHDEGIWEVRDDQAETLAPIVQAKMIEAAKVWVPDIPIEVEFPKGTNGVVDWWAKEV